MSRFSYKTYAKYLYVTVVLLSENKAGSLSRGGCLILSTGMDSSGMFNFHPIRDRAGKLGAKSNLLTAHHHEIVAR